MFEGGGRSARAEVGRNRCAMWKPTRNCRGSVRDRVWEHESFGKKFTTHATLCDRHFEDATKKRP